MSEFNYPFEEVPAFRIDGKAVGAVKGTATIEVFRNGGFAIRAVTLDCWFGKDETVQLDADTNRSLWLEVTEWLNHSEDLKDKVHDAVDDFDDDDREYLVEFRRESLVSRECGRAM